MMADAGEYMTDECLLEAIAFRQAMARLQQEITARRKDDWWFGVWQPDEVNGQPFAEADPDLLRTDSDAWVLKAGAARVPPGTASAIWAVTTACWIPSR